MMNAGPGGEMCIFSDGEILVKFTNGDVKKVLTDGTVMYYYKDRDVTHIQHTF